MSSNEACTPRYLFNLSVQYIFPLRSCEKHTCAFFLSSFSFLNLNINNMASTTETAAQPFDRELKILSPPKNGASIRK